MTLFGREIHFRGHRRHRRRGRRRIQESTTGLTLADVHPGWRVRVVGFVPGLCAKRRAHLQAYGLVPGYWVEVIQHSPVTIIQVDYTELALERDLARQVVVEL